MNGRLLLPYLKKVKERWYPLDLEKKSKEILKVRKIIRQDLIGQNEAVAKVERVFNRVLSPVKRETLKKRPSGTFLFLGPTGVGKTLLAKLIAKIVTGDPDGLIRVDCAGFRHSHEIAKLIGSPPGYVGNRILPILSQRSIRDPYLKVVVKKSARNYGVMEKFFRKKEILEGEQQQLPGVHKQQWVWKSGLPIYSVILFDEIEKASPALFNLLLGIIDNAQLRMGNNELTSFENSIIIMTGNIGSTGINKLLNKEQIGFSRPDQSQKNSAKQIKSIVNEGIKKYFTPELIGRLKAQGAIVVFQPLSQKEILRIFNLQFSKLLTSLAKNFPIQLILTKKAKKYLLKRLSTNEYGAREISALIEHRIFSKIASLINSGEIMVGDIIKIDYCETEAKKLIFERAGRAKGQKDMIRTKKKEEKLFLGLD